MINNWTLPSWVEVIMRLSPRPRNNIYWNKFSQVDDTSQGPTSKKSEASLISEEGLPDFQEEELVVLVFAGHAFADGDRIVDALQETGVQRPAAGGEDAAESLFEVTDELLEGLDATADDP